MLQPARFTRWHSHTNSASCPPWYTQSSAYTATHAKSGSPEKSRSVAISQLVPPTCVTTPKHNPTRSARASLSS